MFFGIKSLNETGNHDSYPPRKNQVEHEKNGTVNSPVVNVPQPPQPIDDQSNTTIVIDGSQKQDIQSALKEWGSHSK